MQQRVLMQRRVLVEISEHRIGGITIQPVNKRLRERCYRRIIEEHKRGAPQMHTDFEGEATEKCLRSGSVILVQADWEAEDVLRDISLCSGERGHLSRGYSVRKLVDIDMFNLWFCHYNQMPDLEGLA